MNPIVITLPTEPESPFLSDQDLAAMRATVNASLPDTAVIQTNVVTDDSGGGGVSTWTPAGTVSCRIAPLTGATERSIASRIAEDADSVVTLPTSSTVSAANRIVINGTTYDVLALRAARSFEVSRRVEVKKLA